MDKLANTISHGAFFFLGLFPILPFRLKPVGVVLFFISALLSLKFYKSSSLTTLFLYFLSLYFFYIISNIFSTQSTLAIEQLITMFSFIALPFSISIVSHRISKKGILLFESVWVLSSSAVSIFIIVSSTLIFMKHDRFLVNELVKILNALPYWDFHPIYVSIYLIIGNIFSLQKLRQKQTTDYSNLFFFLLNSIAIIFLARKSAVIFLALLFIFFIYGLYKNYTHKKTWFVLLLVVILLLGAFFSEVPKRLMEVFVFRSFNKLEFFSSTSIRYNIYKSILNNIHQTPFFGYGFVNLRSVLTHWYPNEMPGYFNSHNQYLSTFLVTGYLGLLTFLLLLRAVFLQVKSYFTPSLLIFFLIYIMFFENILERQNGVIVFTLIFIFCKPNEDNTNRPTSKSSYGPFNSQ